MYQNATTHVKQELPMPLKTMFGKHVGVAIVKPASVCSSVIPTFCVGKRACVQPIAESNIIICNCKRYSSVLRLQWKTTSNAGSKTQKGQEVMTLASLIAVVAAARQRTTNLGYVINTKGDAAICLHF